MPVLACTTVCVYPRDLRSRILGRCNQWSSYLCWKTGYQVLEILVLFIIRTSIPCVTCTARSETNAYVLQREHKRAEALQYLKQTDDRQKHVTETNDYFW